MGYRSQNDEKIQNQQPFVPHYKRSDRLHTVRKGLKNLTFSKQSAKLALKVKKISDYSFLSDLRKFGDQTYYDTTSNKSGATFRLDFTFPYENCYSTFE